MWSVIATTKLVHAAGRWTAARIPVVCALMLGCSYCLSGHADTSVPTGVFSEPASLRGPEGMSAAQTLSPDSASLSVLLTGFSAMAKEGNASSEFTSQALSLTIPIVARTRGSKVVLDVRGDVTHDKRVRCLVVAATATAVQKGDVGSARSWRLTFPVMRDTKNLAVTIVLSCSSTRLSGSLASIDSLDFAWARTTQ